MLKDLCNHWLTFHETRLASKEISKRTFDENFSVCEFWLGVIRKEREVSTICPEDFANVREALSKRYGLNGISKRITQIRSLVAVIQVLIFNA